MRHRPILVIAGVLCALPLLGELLLAQAPQAPRGQAPAFQRHGITDPTSAR